MIAAFNTKLKYLVKESKGLWGLLRKVYPNYPWRFEKQSEPLKQNNVSAKSYLALSNCIHEIFPIHDVCVNYIHPLLNKPS